MPFELPKLDPTDAAAFALECRQIAQRQDASVAGYRRDYVRSVEQARRRKTAAELGMLVHGGAGATPPNELLSAAGRWWTADEGVTEVATDVSAWEDQINAQVMSVGGNTTPNLVSDYITFNGTTDALDFTPYAKVGLTAWYLGMWRRRTSTAAVQCLWSEWGAATAKFVNNYMNLSGSAEVFLTGSASNKYALCTIDTWEYEEVVYNGAEATPADRIRLYRDLIEVSRTATSGTIPASYAGANPTNGALARYSLGAQNSGVRIHAVYSDNVIPDEATRLALMTYSAPV